MKRRCADQGHVAYHRYGGRGINVCQRWLSSFDAFVEDMGGVRPEGHTLNRIHNDGNYEPTNCNWATQKEQVANQQPRRQIAFDGLTLTVRGWAVRTGLSILAINKRLRAGWAVERALTEPLKTDSPELMRAAAARAGASVQASKRGFSRDKQLAKVAGALGGRATAKKNPMPCRVLAGGCPCANVAP